MPIRHSAPPAGRSARPLTMLAAAILLGACEVQRTPRALVIDADSARAAEIDATLSAYADAVRAGDIRRSVTFFTSDARIYSPGAGHTVGRNMIRDLLQESLADGTAQLGMEREMIEVAGDSIAYELGVLVAPQSDVGADSDDGAERVGGHYMIRWRREPQATWRIHTMLLSPAPPDSVQAPAAAENAVR